MSFMSVLPTVTFVLLGFALLGFCSYLKSLYRCGSKIKFFNEYRNALGTFHNRYVEDNEIDSELSDYLLENAHKVNSNTGASINESNAYYRFSRDILSEIINIVNFRCYNFTESCQNVQSILTVCIGALKEGHQNTRSKIINPMHLVKNGVTTLFRIIPIVRLIPTRITNILSSVFFYMTVIDTISSLVLKKQILQDLVKSIIQKFM